MPATGITQRLVRHRCTQGGFTLLELIVSLFLVGLLTSIFGMGLVAAIQGYDYNRTNVEVAQKAQMAMARISRELQELVAIGAISDADAGQDPFIIYDRVVEASDRPEQHTFGLHFNAACIRLYTNLDDVYAQVPDALSGSDINNGDLLIDQVQSFGLKFFKGQNTWSLGMDITQLSAIEITMEIAWPDAPGKTVEFRTLIHLRNTNNMGGATVS